jgi:hypothetical protein
LVTERDVLNGERSNELDFNGRRNNLEYKNTMTASVK